MLKVGLTGNIGSGKTTVSKVFELLGVPVFYADDAAKSAMVADEILVQDIKSAFGAAAYFANGSLNRKYLASIVFNDEQQLTKLNSLVHPATFRAFEVWVKACAEVPYVLKEAALLFESDSYKMCDLSILVKAPLDLRVQRVVNRDRLTPEEVKSRDAHQFTEEHKAGLADYLITNDESTLVIPQVLELHRMFLNV